jgi:hypothetical protein
VSVPMSCEALAEDKVASLFRHAQRQMRVGHFEKRQHDLHMHKIGFDYTLSERNVLEKSLQFTMNKENVLSRRGT